MAEQTFNRWKHRAIVDQGLTDNSNSADIAELWAANKRIKALESELKLVKYDSEVFDAQAVVPPKDARLDPVD